MKPSSNHASKKSPHCWSKKSGNGSGGEDDTVENGSFVSKTYTNRYWNGWTEILCTSDGKNVLTDGLCRYVPRTALESR